MLLGKTFTCGLSVGLQISCAAELVGWRKQSSKLEQKRVQVLKTLGTSARLTS